jgi:hypothetical protein
MPRPGQPLLHVSAPSAVLPITDVVVILDPANCIVSGGKVVSFGSTGTSIAQANTAKQATFLSTANGVSKPAAQFVTNAAGSLTNYYVLPDLSTLAECEMFAVLANTYSQTNVWASDNQTGAWDMSTGTHNTHYTYVDANVYDTFGCKPGGATSRFVSSSGFDQTAMRSPHLYNVAAAYGTWTARFNAAAKTFGIAGGTLATFTPGFSAAPKFGECRDAGYGYSGNLFFLAVCSKVQTAGARAAMEAYLKAAYALPY